MRFTNILYQILSSALYATKYSNLPNLLILVILVKTAFTEPNNKSFLLECYK